MIIRLRCLIEKKSYILLLLFYQFTYLSRIFNIVIVKSPHSEYRGLLFHKRTISNNVYVFYAAISSDYTNCDFMFSWASNFVVSKDYSFVENYNRKSRFVHHLIFTGFRRKLLKPQNLFVRLCSISYKSYSNKLTHCFYWAISSRNNLSSLSDIIWFFFVLHVISLIWL